MQTPIWNRASDIDQWGKSISARTLLPELIRRLVFGTVERPNLLHINFPAGDEAQRHGFDGETKAVTATTFVPDGFTIWEISCDADPEDKADRDYEARIADPKGIDLLQTTFIAVTARKWTGAPNWQRKKCAEGKFRNVMAFDSNSLEHWLCDAPAVGLWLAKERGLASTNFVDIYTHWKNVLHSLKSVILPEVLLVNRSGTVKSFSDWLANNPGVLSVNAASPAELVDFFCAWVHSLSQIDADVISSRSIIVNDTETWRELASCQQRLILIAGSSGGIPPEALAEAKRHGHHLLRYATFTEMKNASTTVLERMRTEDLKQALLKSGLAERLAAQLAESAGGTFTVFKRRYAGDVSYTCPTWASPSESVELAPLLLAAAWNEKNEHDRKILEALASKPYTEVQKLATRWRQVSDAPLRHILGIWEFISPQDAWVLLHAAITESNASTFSNVAFEVLSEADPAFELPPEERYMAQVKGHVAKFSDALRRGIAEILALSCTRAGDSIVSDEHDFAGRGRLIIRRLLTDNCDWKRWASIGHLLSLLAEAAPDEFMDAVESDLNSASPELVKLLGQEHNKGFGGAIYHAGLLWALEILGCSSHYLSRVTNILAKLNEQDVGGVYGNRPIGSLKSLFFSWRPQTMATVDERLLVLQRLVEKHQKTAWQLLLALLPNNSDSISDTAKPLWRNWAAGWTGNVENREYWNYISGILDLGLSVAESKKELFVQLIDECMSLPASYLSRVVTALEHCVPEQIAPDTRFILWNKLRETIETHLSFQDSKWARSQLELQKLRSVMDKFNPTDLVEQNLHLFDYAEMRKRIRHGKREDAEAQIIADRIKAVQQLLNHGGLTEVCSLATRSIESWTVGFALARVPGIDIQDTILPNYLSREEKLIQLALGFVGALMEIKGRAWAESLPNAGWAPHEVQRLSRIMPFDEQTWNWIARYGDNVATLYWLNVGVWGPTLTAAQYDFAFTKLIEVRRIGITAQLAGAALYHDPGFAPETLFKVLEAVTEATKEELAGMDANDVAKMFESLQKDGRSDQNRLATLEFAFLPTLGQFTQRALTLERMVVDDPQFFVDCLKLMYKPRHRDKEEPSEEEISSQDRAKGKACWHLLHEWRRIPGTQNDGSISQKELIEWLSNARKFAREVDRLEVADNHIGQLFAFAPSDEKGVRPCVPVRDAIEFCDSKDVIRGFQIGIRNARGVYSKGAYEGGRQERTLAENFAEYARACEARWPITAAALRGISEDYLEDAKREDERTELRD